MTNKIQNLKFKIQNYILITIIYTAAIIQIHNVYAFTTNEVVKRVKETFKNSKTINTEFTQTVNHISLKNKQVKNGIIKIKMPDKLLMTYDKPKESRQKLIINRNKFLLYLENTNEVMKKNIEDSESEVEKQIFPWMEHLNDYNIKVLTENEKYIELYVTPGEKSQQEFKKLNIQIDSEKWLVINTSMTDLNNNIIEFVFFNSSINTNISDKEFEFIPPKDADILEEK